MDATHRETDAKNITHHFCEHHSIKDLNLSNKNSQNKYQKLLPLFLVFLFIFTFPVIRQINGVNGMLYMMDFMGIFFLVFGMFKLLDLKGFVVGFQQYDFVARRFPAYGYAYPFIEIGLGILYLMGYMFLWQNILVAILATIGIYTAYKYTDHKDDIRCVCLGTMFDLPMTWVTLSENALMLVMVLFMIAM